MDQEVKISELTLLPGALDPAALLAIVQGGVTYHATGEQVSNMVLGNISVIENTGTGQWNARIPIGASGGIQIDYNPAAEATQDNTVRLRGTAPYLRSFGAAVRPFITLPELAAYYSNGLTVHQHSYLPSAAPSASGANLYILKTAGANVATGATITNITVLAVGRY